MSATQLVAEFLIIGALSIFGVSIISGQPLDFGLSSTINNDVVFATLSLSVAYVIGFFTNVVAEIIFRPLYRRIEFDWATKWGNPEVLMDHARYDVYVASSSEIIQRLEYHRSLLRLSRSLSIVSLILLFAAISQGQLIQSLVLFFILLISVFAYQRRVFWFTKSVYFSWIAHKRAKDKSSGKLKSNQQLELAYESNPKDLKNLAILAGGTGFRQINIKLSESYSYDLSRIVPIWDNGGSSKILRQHFSVIPVGDVRHTLMTMAHGEGRVDDVVRLFNWRLPDSGTNQELHLEFAKFVSGEHPMIEPIDSSLKDAIITYLKHFESSLPDNFDLRRGSIGNFVLTGAFLAHGKNMNTAIYVFRQLCSIRGKVWPISLMPNLHIGAELEDGQKIIGQELVTNLDRERHRARIKNIFFTEKLDGTDSVYSDDVQINPLVADALKEADLLIWGPGSFFTSVIPHMMVKGVADLVASLEIPKVLITNIAESSESYNYTIEELVDIFLNVAHARASTKRTAHRYLTHIIAHDNQDMTFLQGSKKRYLPLGKNLDKYIHEGISIINADFEDTWNRGFHDAKKIMNLIDELIL